MAAKRVRTRDLFAEGGAAEASASVKRSKSEEPASLPEKEELMARTGGPDSANVMALVLSANDAACDEAKAEQDEERMMALTLVPGVYWFVGLWSGVQCFRQQPAEDDQPNNQQLFCFYAELPMDKAGWYIASAVFQGVKEMSQVEIFAWAEPSDDHVYYPIDLVVPYWADKKNKKVGDIIVKTWQQHIDDILVNLEGENDTFRDQLADIEANKQARQPGQHGGWLPKAARLITTYWKRKWNRMDAMTQEFYDGSEALRASVDSMLGKGKGKSTGKGKATSKGKGSRAGFWRRV